MHTQDIAWVWIKESQSPNDLFLLFPVLSITIKSGDHFKSLPMTHFTCLGREKKKIKIIFPQLFKSLPSSQNKISESAVFGNRPTYYTHQRTEVTPNAPKNVTATAISQKLNQELHRSQKQTTVRFVSVISCISDLAVFVAPTTDNLVKEHIYLVMSDSPHVRTHTSRTETTHLHSHQCTYQTCIIRPAPEKAAIVGRRLIFRCCNLEVKCSEKHNYGCRVRRWP